MLPSPSTCGRSGRYEAIRSDESHLESILREGAAKARAIAAKTVETAADRMGLGAGSGAR